MIGLVQAKQKGRASGLFPERGRFGGLSHAAASLVTQATSGASLVTRTASAAFVLGAAALLAGCETTGARSSASPPATSAPKAQAPRFNLTGYSAAFKQGYADACATPRKRNAERFKTDNDYSMGWQDGQSACRAR